MHLNKECELVASRWTIVFIWIVRIETAKERLKGAPQLSEEFPMPIDRVANNTSHKCQSVLRIQRKRQSRSEFPVPWVVGGKEWRPIAGGPSRLRDSLRLVGHRKLLKKNIRSTSKQIREFRRADMDVHCDKKKTLVREHARSCNTWNGNAEQADTVVARHLPIESQRKNTWSTVDCRSKTVGVWDGYITEYQWIKSIPLTTHKWLLRS